MATPIWTGDAEAIAQVDLITVALTWAGADEATVTISDKTLTLTVGTDTDTDEVATAIKEMVNGDAQTGTGDHTFSQTGDNIAEFNGITATVVNSVVTLTADVAGTPFTLTAGETTGGDGTATRSASVANQSPNDWNDATNWSTGSVPVDSDDVIVENSNVAILYGLAQTGVSLASFTVKPTFTGTIGLPRTNTAGYVEYLETYLTLADVGDVVTTIYNIDASGSGRIKIDNIDAQCELNVYGTGTRAEDDVPVLLFVGTHASNILNLNKGDVGVGFFGGEAATLATTRVGYRNARSSDSKLVIGIGCNTTTLVQHGGEVEALSTLTTVTVTAGTLTVGDDAAVTTLNLDGGTCYYESDGNLTQLNVAGGAVIDFRRDARDRTVAATNVYAGGIVYDPMETVTWTNGLDLQRCGLEDVTLELGKHRTWTPSGI